MQRHAVISVVRMCDRFEAVHLPAIQLAVVNDNTVRGERVKDWMLVQLDQHVKDLKRVMGTALAPQPQNIEGWLSDIVSKVGHCVCMFRFLPPAWGVGVRVLALMLLLVLQLLQQRSDTKV